MGYDDIKGTGCDDEKGKGNNEMGFDHTLVTPRTGVSLVLACSTECRYTAIPRSHPESGGVFSWTLNRSQTGAVRLR